MAKIEFERPGIIMAEDLMGQFIEWQIDKKVTIGKENLEKVLIFFEFLLE